MSSSRSLLQCRHDPDQGLCAGGICFELRDTPLVVSRSIKPRDARPCSYIVLKVCPFRIHLDRLSCFLINRGHSQFLCRCGLCLINTSSLDTGFENITCHSEWCSAYLPASSFRPYIVKAFIAYSTVCSQQSGPAYKRYGED